MKYNKLLILILLALLPIMVIAQPDAQQQSNKKKMKVDIWSDVMCPFCYIGKRHFEEALAKFENGKDIEVVWHSFQLDPDAEAQPGKSAYEYLAERKGQSLEWSKQVHSQVTQMAADAGLTYNFDKAVVANSFDAHRIVQLAKKHGKGDAMEEQLFKAYFTEGKDIANDATLTELATSIGLNKEEVEEVLSSDKYADDVQEDVATASRLGINGVPFFVINNKYGVSGAQPSATFVQALQQAWAEYEKEKSPLTMVDGDAATCEPGKDCE